MSSSPTGQYRVLCPLTTMPRRFTDFLVMSCDLVTDVPLGEVLDKHRVNQGALTVLLARQLQEDKPGQKKKKTDDYVVVDSSNDTLLMLENKKGLKKDVLDVRRRMLLKYSRVSVCNDLQDVHLYIFAHWVSDLLEQKSEFRSIKSELVPFLLRKQYSMSEADLGLFVPSAALSGSSQPQLLVPDVANPLQYTSTLPSWSPGPPGVEQLHCHWFAADVTQVECGRVDTLVLYAEANRKAAKAYTPGESPDRSVPCTHW